VYASRIAKQEVCGQCVKKVGLVATVNCPMTQ